MIKLDKRPPKNATAKVCDHPSISSVKADVFLALAAPKRCQSN
jgi:hypothetical protein